MKKIFLVFLISFAFLFLFSEVVQAAALCTDSGATGLVPCGVTQENNVLTCPCQFRHFFLMAERIFNFAVWTIAFPIAAFMIVLGGILIMLSGGPGGKNPVTGTISPNLYSTAKNMIVYSIIGLILILGSWLIIDVVLKAIGYVLPWDKL